jgi:hypothetical protein
LLPQKIVNREKMGFPLMFEKDLDVIENSSKILREMIDRL